MISALSPGLLAAAKQEYEQLLPTLQIKFPGQFIVIDPISKEYFIASRLAEALSQAITKFPDRQFYSTRIGSRSAVTFS